MFIKICLFMFVGSVLSIMPDGTVVVKTNTNQGPQGPPPVSPEFAQLQHELNKIFAMFANIKGENNGMKGEINNLRGKLNGAGQEIGRLKAEVKNWKAKASRCNTGVTIGSAAPAAN